MVYRCERRPRAKGECTFAPRHAFLKVIRLRLRRHRSGSTSKSPYLSSIARISPQDRPDWLAGSQVLRDDSESQLMGTSMNFRMMQAQMALTLGAALLLAACGSSGSD